MPRLEEMVLQGWLWPALGRLIRTRLEMRPVALGGGIILAFPPNKCYMTGSQFPHTLPRQGHCCRSAGACQRALGRRRPTEEPAHTEVVVKTQRMADIVLGCRLRPVRYFHHLRVDVDHGGGRASAASRNLPHGRRLSASVVRKRTGLEVLDASGGRISHRMAGRGGGPDDRGHPCESGRLYRRC